MLAGKKNPAGLLGGIKVSMGHRDGRRNKSFQYAPQKQ